VDWSQKRSRTARGTSKHRSRANSSVVSAHSRLRERVGSDVVMDNYRKNGFQWARRTRGAVPRGQTMSAAAQPRR